MHVVPCPIPGQPSRITSDGPLRSRKVETLPPEYLAFRRPSTSTQSCGRGGVVLGRALRPGESGFSGMRQPPENLDLAEKDPENVVREQIGVAAQEMGV